MAAKTNPSKRTARASKRPAAKKATRPRRRPGRPTLLTDDVAALITNAIAAGAFDHVAAEAAGVHPGTYRRWMAKGEDALELAAAEEAVPADLAPFADFAVGVRRARAQARTRAENRVFTENPLAWLRYGPGRQRGDSDGWTAALHAEVEHSGEVRSEVTVVFEGDDWRGDPTDDEGGDDA